MACFETRNDLAEVEAPLPILPPPYELSQPPSLPSCLWLCSLQIPAPRPQSASMSHRPYQTPQRMQQTNVALLGRESVGNKVTVPHPSLPLTILLSSDHPHLHLMQEPTGFTLNNPSYVRSSYEPGRDQQYLTTYNEG